LLCFAEIGIGLTGAGVLFMLLGMMMFFDKGLLAMGNVCHAASLLQCEVVSATTVVPAALCSSFSYQAS
jgi:hypothetical protein